MVVTEDKARVAVRIGKIDFTIEKGTDSDEPRLRPEARVEALAAWLFSEWQREHPEAN